MKEFSVFFERLPISYKVFVYEKKMSSGKEGLAIAIERDLKVFLFDHLSHMQQFDSVKIYYDGGQSVVTRVWCVWQFQEKPSKKAAKEADEIGRKGRERHRVACWRRIMHNRLPDI